MSKDNERLRYEENHGTSRSEKYYPQVSKLSFMSKGSTILSREMDFENSQNREVKFLSRVNENVINTCPRVSRITTLLRKARILINFQRN
jgi:hypothetical protein